MGLKDNLGKEITFSTELGPVKGTNLAALMETLAGYEIELDAINIHDCPGANLRMDPFVEAFRVHQKTGVDVIPHLTCRDAPLTPEREKPIDTKLLRLQSRLLGAHELGIRYVLATGGDLKQEKYLATIDLIKLIAGLNRGVNAKGKEFQGPTEFTIVATANPGAKDLDGEISRMQEKIEAGASLFQTQAAYDPDQTAEFLKKAKSVGKPVLLGIMPLKGAKMASYMMKLGIPIPDVTIQELKGGKAGSELCCAFLDSLVKDQGIRPEGVHVMALGDIEATNVILGKFKKDHM